MKKLLLLGVLALVPAPALAQSDELRCNTEQVWNEKQERSQTIIKCVVTADKVTLGKIVINRGNCQSANDALADVFKKLRNGLPPEVAPLVVPQDLQGEHRFGDTIVIAPMCPSVLEFSIEVNGQAVTYTPPQ